MLPFVSRCEIRQSCQGIEDHGQPHHCLSFIWSVSITFLIIPYIAQRPMYTFLAISQRLYPCLLMSQILLYFQWIGFLPWTIFFMILLDVLLLHMLYFILNYSAHAGFQHKLLHRLIKTFIATSKKSPLTQQSQDRETKIAITEPIHS